MGRSAGEILADPYLKGTWVHSDSTHSMDMYLLSFSQSPRTRLSQGIAAQVHVLQRPFRECVEKDGPQSILVQCIVIVLPNKNGAGPQLCN